MKKNYSVVDEAQNTVLECRQTGKDSPLHKSVSRHWPCQSAEEEVDWLVDVLCIGISVVWVSGVYIDLQL